MNERPLITIIIPFFNRIKSTISSLYSALNQSYNNIEIIIIDDCSTEDITELLDVVKNNLNVFYHRNLVNLGSSFSRNKGIKYSKGDYISFLDSDDIFKPDKINLQLNFMIKKNSSFSYTSYFRSYGNKVSLVRCNLIPMVYPLIAFYCPIATPTVMIKKEILNNFKFNNQSRFGEDLILWIQLSKNNKFYRLNKPLSIVNIGISNHGLNYEVQKLVREMVGKELYSNKFLYIIHWFYCMIRFLSRPLKTYIIHTHIAFEDKYS